MFSLVIIVVIIIRDLHNVNHGVDENHHETNVTNCWKGAPIVIGSR